MSPMLVWIFAWRAGSTAAAPAAPKKQTKRITRKIFSIVISGA